MTYLWNRLCKARRNRNHIDLCFFRNKFIFSIFNSCILDFDKSNVLRNMLTKQDYVFDNYLMNWISIIKLHRKRLTKCIVVHWIRTMFRNRIIFFRVFFELRVLNYQFDWNKISFTYFELIFNHLFCKFILRSQSILKNKTIWN